MKLINTKTVVIATYTAEQEPTDAPSGETSDIVRVIVKRVSYEFRNNSPIWGSMLPEYTWKPYRRSSGPLGWLVAENN